MQTRHWTRRSFLVLLGALLSGLVWAEQSVSVGDFTIHYNAFTTDTLTPQVARQFKIQRSRNKAMLTVSVVKSEMVGVPKSVPAEVSVQAANLSGQLKKLQIREIKEGDAIYYIAVFPVANEETLDFTLRVKPAGAPKTYTIHYRKQFFTQ